MRSAVKRILEGKFNKDTYFLDFSIAKLELLVHSGEQYEGSFTIEGAKDMVTEGKVYSDSLRMKCLTDHFIGSREEILFRFDADGMKPGDQVKGQLCVISNHGEYTLPYQVEVIETPIDSSLGMVRNLFHFTNLARSNYKEAVELFYSPEFKDIFSGVDRQYEGLYRGLSGGEKKAQNVEEFLLAVKKKQKVDFIPENSEIKIKEPEDFSAEYRVALNRNGWGYSELKVEAEGDFLVLEKHTVTEEDFVDNCCRLPFYLSADRLHAGNNYGKICFRNAYNDIEIRVIVSQPSVQNKLMAARREKQLTVELMKDYEAFRTRKIAAQEWMQETEKLVSELIEQNESKLAYRLFQAQLYITQERYSEAEWILNNAQEEIQREYDPTLYCYCLYLGTLLNREEEYIDETARQVERIYTQNTDNWRIAWLLLYLSEEYSRNPARKWMALESQFRQGASSPVLYIEAYNLMNSNPTLLSSLDAFELQVLTYAWKKNLLNQAVAEQIVFLSFKFKNYSGRVYQLLTKCYELLPGDEALRAICTMLIKGGVTSAEAHKWYALGIERELRITRLYEYFMMSCELSDKLELPKVVLMYFAFDSNLDSLHNAFLYAYVYMNREVYPELYESYREQIERFVVFQILKERNNQWLSVLYRNLITERMITEETARGLATAAFIQRLYVKRADIRKIILIYEKQKEEVTFEINTREVYLPVYGSDMQLFLEDGKGNRYCSSEDYELERLMIPDKMVTMLEAYVQDNISFDIWNCERGKALVAINDGNLERMKRVLASGLLRTAFQHEMLMNLLHYYYDGEHLTELDLFLNKLTVEMLSGSEYTEVVHIMINRGMYEKAYEWIRVRGGYGIDAKNIMRLCSRLIDMGTDIDEDVMSILTHYAFLHGKYDENLLKYLNCHYLGTTKEMKNIFKAAVSFGVDAYEISERILIQLLYTGAYLSETAEIFRYYVSQGADADVEMAFLAQHCYDYFVEDKVADGSFLKEIQRVMDRQEDVPLVWKLAYTKFFAENKSRIEEETTRYLTAYLRELLSMHLVFPYYKEYADHLAFMRRFADKTMIQYKLETGKKAVIHYLPDAEDGEYRVEEIPEMFDGICVKQFILFFGEKIQYYITETDGEKEHLTLSGTLSRSDTDRDQKESRYSLINDIAIGRTLNDENTMGSFLRDYYEKEFIVDHLFHIR